MRKLLIFSLILLSNRIISQKSKVLFSYTDIPYSETPKIGLSNDNKLYVIYNDDKNIRVGLFDLKSQTKNSYDIKISDSFEIKKQQTIIDSFFIGFLEKKKNLYTIKINLNSGDYKISEIQESIIKTKTTQEGKPCFEGKQKDTSLSGYYQKSENIISFYKSIKNLPTEKIEFKLDNEINLSGKLKKMCLEFAKEDITYINPLRIDLMRLSKSKKSFYENDKVYYLNDEDLRKFEVLIFDLKAKKITKSEIELNDKFCFKEPNGKFYSTSIISNEKLFVQVNCRHNSNLFIIDIASGGILKKYSIEDKDKNSISNIDYLFENFKKGTIEINKSDEKFLQNNDVHPNFINVLKNNDYYIVNHGSYYISKTLKPEDLLFFASVFLTSSNFFQQNILTDYQNAFMFGFDRMPQVGSVKYLSYVLNSDFSINEKMTNILNNAKLSYQFYQKSKDDWTIIFDKKRYDFEYDSQNLEFKIVE